jgi:hypothetical protein
MNFELMEAGLAPENVDLALVRRPTALTLLTISSWRFKTTILVELDMPPTVPIPFCSFHPRELL